MDWEDLKCATLIYSVQNRETIAVTCSYELYVFNKFNY
jgi:hypothetical protein